jgi:hypothetical protein
MQRLHAADGNALDLLEEEDLRLRAAFGQLRATSVASVEQRAEYGDLAKSVIRRVATREAALVDVAHVAADVSELGAVTDRLAQQATIRRPSLHRVEKMSRGVHGINLNTGQDFDKEFTELMQIVGSEIEWDLDEAVPAVRRALEQRGRVGELSSAHKVVQHAPTQLDPGGARWYERAPLISRLITMYDQLRDFPRAVRRS